MHPARFVVINLGSEPNHVVLPLCRGVDPGSRDTVVRSLLEVASKEILAQRLPHFLEEVPKMADDRKVPRHSVVTLSQIADRDDGQPERQKAECDQSDTHECAPSRIR
jgi:hypothetical protein